jgi:hypothetical protein
MNQFLIEWRTNIFDVGVGKKFMNTSFLNEECFHSCHCEEKIAQRSVGILNPGESREEIQGIR